MQEYQKPEVEIVKFETMENVMSGLEQEGGTDSSKELGWE